MAIMESSNSISSRESLYSVESEDEDEEQPQQPQQQQPRCGDGEVFLSDSESEKDVGPPRPRREACPDRRNFYFSPQSGRTNPGLLFRGHKRRPLAQEPLARRQPGGPCCHHPKGAFCGRLAGADGEAASPRRAEGGARKRLSSVLGGGQPHLCTAPPAVSGKKRQRNEEAEAKEDSHTPCWTARDLLFAQKCWELQGFVRPMMELLNRLKTGRFDRALSSFQQSVAMDRIQRIIGVLQKPEMGERYLSTLLQVERMLKVWFPHIALKASHANSAAEAAEETCTAGKNSQKEPPERRAAHGCAESPPTEELHHTHLTDPACPDHKGTAPLGEAGSFLGDWPTMNMTWVHTAPISNPPLGHVDLSQASPAFGRTLLGPGAGSAYGVIVFLPNNPAAAPGQLSHPVAPPGSFHTSSGCCHPCVPASGPGEHPRCQSLPGPTVTGSHLPTGTLGCCFSKSLPNLRTSVTEGRQRAPNGTPTSRCAS